MQKKASVNYSINGQYDSKQLKQQQSDFQKFGASIGSLTKLIPAGFFVGIGQEIAQMAKQGLQMSASFQKIENGLKNSVAAFADYVGGLMGIVDLESQRTQKAIADRMAGLEEARKIYTDEGLNKRIDESTAQWVEATAAQQEQLSVVNGLNAQMKTMAQAQIEITQQLGQQDEELNRQLGVYQKQLVQEQERLQILQKEEESRKNQFNTLQRERTERINAALNISQGLTQTGQGTSKEDQKNFAKEVGDAIKQQFREDREQNKESERIRGLLSKAQDSAYTITGSITDELRNIFKWLNSSELDQGIRTVTAEEINKIISNSNKQRDYSINLLTNQLGKLAEDLGKDPQRDKMITVEMNKIIWQIERLEKSSINKNPINGNIQGLGQNGQSYSISAAIVESNKNSPLNDSINKLIEVLGDNLLSEKLEQSILDLIKTLREKPGSVTENQIKEITTAIEKSDDRGNRQIPENNQQLMDSLNEIKLTLNRLNKSYKSSIKIYGDLDNQNQESLKQMSDSILKNLAEDRPLTGYDPEEFERLQTVTNEFQTSLLQTINSLVSLSDAAKQQRDTLQNAGQRESQEYSFLKDLENTIQETIDNLKYVYQENIDAITSQTIAQNELTKAQEQQARKLEVTSQILSMASSSVDNLVSSIIAFDEQNWGSGTRGITSAASSILTGIGAITGNPVLPIVGMGVDLIGGITQGVYDLIEHFSPEEPERNADGTMIDQGQMGSEVEDTIKGQTYSGDIYINLTVDRSYVGSDPDDVARDIASRIESMVSAGTI